MTMEEQQKEYAARFAALPDDFDRYTLLMQLAMESPGLPEEEKGEGSRDRKSTLLNSSHS